MNLVWNVATCTFIKYNSNAIEKPDLADQIVGWSLFQSSVSACMFEEITHTFALQFAHTPVNLILAVIFSVVEKTSESPSFLFLHDGENSNSLGENYPKTNHWTAYCKSFLLILSTVKVDVREGRYDV